MPYTRKLGVIPVTYQVGWTLDGPLLCTHYIPVEQVYTDPYKLYRR